nr:hypothetical protein L204_03157 [Cryptococcus depauperatus CBS 7855]
MPSRIPLPKLTLYTGGKECSLCEIAKEQLSILRRTHPFDLDLFNIRKPLPGVDPREAKKWRRLYQPEEVSKDLEKALEWAKAKENHTGRRAKEHAWLNRVAEQGYPSG